ncbi:hypothetical protein Tco_0994520 [Tanacetum coccineum]
MSEEDQTVDVTVLPKFDMPSYESEMTSKDVKSLALRHGIPLDLHPVALTKGLYEQYFEFSGIRVPFSTFLLALASKGIGFLLRGGLVRVPEVRRAIPDAMVWRDHDSDVNDPVPEDGFQASDVLLLTERVIDLWPVPSGLLCYGGLATTWDFPSIRPIFKDTKGNVVTMSEYLCFPFLSGASISKGPPLTSQDQIEQHTVRPLLIDQPIPEKTTHQKEVEMEDPKIVAARERKARKTSARRDGTSAFEATSSLEPIRTINPNKPSAAVAKTAESREDHSPHESPHGSTNHSVHNYSDAHQGDGGAGTLQLETSDRAITYVDTEVVQPTPSPRNTFHSSETTRPVSPLRANQQGNAEAGESSRRSSLYVPDWSIPQRCPLERAWFALARGALAQTDILERLDVRHSSDLYNSLSDRFKAFSSEHEGCSGRLEASKSRNRELSQANQDQTLRIKELEDTLARKDYALVYAERLNVERAQEKEKLVSQLARTKKEKYNCVRKLLPTVVERLFRSHGYKQSLSGPFNLAIQDGWGKGLAEELSEEDLLELMGRMEGFDVHADTKMKVEYDKLFERQYPYVEKISRGFRHSVSDLLKVYPDSPPSRQASLASAPNQPQD